MNANTLKAIRTIHNYSGVFLAPTILFFAITGGLQMFGLHETSRGSSYVPPALLMHLSQLHKKGTPYLPPKRPVPAVGLAKAEGAGRAQEATPTEGGRGAGVKIPAAVPAVPAPSAATAKPPPNPLPIKMFFALTAAGLVTSTMTGLMMAWKYARRRGLVAAVLAAGVVVPLLLLLV